MGIGNFFRKTGHEFKVIGGVVAKAAPTIAGVASVTVPAAAPFIQAAAGLLGSKLDQTVAPTVEAISQAITTAAASTDPAQLKAVQDADQQMALQLKQLDINSAEEFTRLFLADTADAREMAEKTGDVWTPRLLTAFIMTLAGITLHKVFAADSASALKDPAISLTIGMVIGNVWSDVKQILAYYFGSSQGSAAKNDVIATALQNGSGK